MNEDIDEHDEGCLELIRATEAIIKGFRADREKERQLAKRMHWMFNGGFVAVIVSATLFQSFVLMVIGAVIMAIPMVWASLREAQ